MQDTLRLSALAALPRSSHFWTRILSTLALWHARSRSRRHLALLDDRALADIGLSRAEQWRESRKPFWQA